MGPEALLGALVVSQGEGPGVVPQVAARAVVPQAAQAQAVAQDTFRSHAHTPGNARGR